MAEAGFEVRSANCKASALNLGSKVSSCRIAVTALSPIKISLRVCSASQGQLLHFCISVEVRPCLGISRTIFRCVFFFWFSWHIVFYFLFVSEQPFGYLLFQKNLMRQL